MGAPKSAQQGGDRVLRLAPDLDPTTLPLNRGEGYLLSRVDGSTPWSLLREIGGLAAREVDRCLERWLKEGVLIEAGASTRTAAAPASAAAATAPATAEVDASLDITVELQREILAFEKNLSLPYHELLGVPLDAANPQIKKAYFALSRKYHPDRYFRRNLGAFALRIERIFKKILEAYELLSDPVARAELLKAAPPPPAVSPPPSSTPEVVAPAAPAAPDPKAARQSSRRTATRLSLLAQHRRHLDERRRKAKQLFESGMSSFRAERWLEAARGVRLAIAFDPQNEAFRESFADVQRRAHEEQAKLLTRQADEAYDLREWAQAEKLYEEALHYRPFDASLSARVARLALQCSGDLHKAKECAASACEIEPGNAGYRLVLGRVYKAAGLKANARRELETALRLESGNREAKAELKSL